MRKFVKENWIAMIPYVMFVIMVIVMGALNTNTLSLRYIANKSDAAFSLILVAAGQTLVLLTGGFDLSVGGVICITNCLAASRMQDSVGSMLLWAGICLAVGVGTGLFNGYVIERTKLQPFIVTLNRAFYYEGGWGKCACGVYQRPAAPVWPAASFHVSDRASCGCLDDFQEYKTGPSYLCHRKQRGGGPA